MSAAGIMPGAYGDTVRRQWRVSDPAVSAWVVANAGSGKTHVLTQRVMRLLLAGSDPASILCLTFTKAAAAEMARRVFQELGRWVGMDGDALSEAIRKLQGEPPAPAMLDDARRLFARALETPGGLRIRTIHAFCERLLHQFPLEANVPGQFEVLDETAQRALLAEARNQVLMAARDDAEVSGALCYLAETRADVDIHAALDAVIAERDRYAAWLLWSAAEAGAGTGTVADAIADLGRRLGLRPGDDPDRVAQRFLDGSRFCIAGDWRTDVLAALAANAGPTNDAAAEALAAVAPQLPPAARAAAVLAFYLKKTGEPYSLNGRITRAVQSAFTGFDVAFGADVELCVTLREQLNAATTMKATGALLTVGDAVLARYHALKRSRGALDYDDLISRTRHLLSRPDAAAWVLYKLDAGLDHILVDEAQDTNPAQWEIVAKLAEEFFAGEGVRRATRTIFAVGDDKQSIYSFQGAEPRRLADVQLRFRQAVEGAGGTFVSEPLYLSFRSSTEILDAVDQVFSGALEGRVTSLGYTRHSAIRLDEPGLVTLWPRQVRPSGDPPEDWTAPFDAPTAADEALAEKIAVEIARLVSGRDPLPSGNPVTPGEILILARKRDAFLFAMNRALKRHEIETAGTDRISLSEHIAILDLLALADVMLLPDDDLQLAAVLKSPILGLDDDDLVALAPDRRGSLWRALAASDEPRHKEAAASLSRLQALALGDTPFRFYAHVLAEAGGRAALRGRLGSEVEEVLDVFLSEVLAFETRNAPTLQGLVAHIRAGGGDVKREVDETAGAVRAMTVHGAKGLEADIVFLVDTGSLINAPSHRDIVYPLADAGRPDDPGALVWRQLKADAPSAQLRRQAEEEEAARDEYYRLLYVAMTRAKDRLYVCGIRGQRTEPDCWYATVRDALAPDAERNPETGELARACDWPPQPRLPLPPRAREPASALEARPLPDWATQPVPAAPVTPLPLRPSRALAEPDPVAERRGLAATDAGDAALRGILIHRLLQRLPGLAPAERDTIGHRLLARAGVADQPDRAALLAEALAVIDDPRLSLLFGPQSRAELAVAAEVMAGDRTYAVSGRIDRIATLDDRIVIADFKTGAPIPADLESIEPIHVLQMALYRHALGAIMPGCRCEAWLIWTAGPRALQVPAEAMRSSLGALAIVSETAA